MTTSKTRIGKKASAITIGNMAHQDDDDDDDKNHDDDIDRLIRQDPNLTTIVFGSTCTSLQKLLSLADDVDHAMKNNKHLRSVCFHERLIQSSSSSSDYKSMTSSRRLRSLWESTCRISTIEEIDIQRLRFENPYDIHMLANGLRNHPTLKHFHMNNFTVHIMPSLSSSSSSVSQQPLLELLFDALSSIPNLESLQLKCQAYYCQMQRRNPNHPNQQQDHQQQTVVRPSYVSIKGLETLLSGGDGCRRHHHPQVGSKLTHLSLSNLNLGDDEFKCISQTIDIESSHMTELILNDNLNTEKGVNSILDSSLLSKFQGRQCSSNSNNGCIDPTTNVTANTGTKINRLEVYNTNRVGKKTCDKLLEILTTNCSINHIKINTKSQRDREQLQFQTLLNRCGRKTILDPQTDPDTIIEILASASRMTTATTTTTASVRTSSRPTTNNDDGLSVIWRFLRDRPSILTSCHNHHNDRCNKKKVDSGRQPTQSRINQMEDNIDESSSEQDEPYRQPVKPIALSGESPPSLHVSTLSLDDDDDDCHDCTTNHDRDGIKSEESIRRKKSNRNVLRNLAAGSIQSLKRFWSSRK